MVSNRKQLLIFAIVLAVGAMATMSGCAGSTNAAAPVPPPVAVAVMEVSTQSVPIYAEYAAQTFARDMVDVRGRVDGYVEKRLFRVGSNVKAGDVLYVLDLRPYQAEVAKARADLAQGEANLDFARRQVGLAQAEADLAQSEANLLKAKQDVERLRPLVEVDAAAKQDLDNAQAALQASQANVNARKASVEQSRISTSTQINSVKAQVDANRAMVQTAELNLEYATIKAPITGRIGDSLIQVGGLVTRSSPEPLTTIVPLDPIWVRFKVSESKLVEYMRRDAKSLPLQLILGDNAVHPHPGRFENTVNQVDPKTGTLEVQVTFPNPEGNILPGQFGRIRLKSAERPEAILIPQKAVQELQGMQSVLTVGRDNKVVARSVVTGDRIDERWVIEQGLKPGDRVIVEGLQKAQPGAVVNPRPYKATPAPTAGSQEKKGA